MEDLPGWAAVADKVIEKEIVQLVGANEIFGLLGDGAVLLGGEQLGAHWGIQDIIEHGGQRFIAAGIGGVAHQRIYALCELAGCVFLLPTL